MVRASSARVLTTGPLFTQKHSESSATIFLEESTARAREVCASFLSAAPLVACDARALEADEEDVALAFDARVRVAFFAVARDAVFARRFLATARLGVVFEGDFVPAFFREALAFFSGVVVGILCEKNYWIMSATTSYFNHTAEERIGATALST